MSATSQPIAGQSKSAAPFGAVAVIAGALALGAVGIALGQGIKATPTAGVVPADVQAALIAQRAGEKVSLFPARDPRLMVHQSELADRGATTTLVLPNGRIIQHQGELDDRFGSTFPKSIAGPATGLQKGLTNPLRGKVVDDLVAAPNRWTVLATNPYAQHQLSQSTVAGSAPKAVGPSTGLNPAGYAVAPKAVDSAAVLQAMRFYAAAYAPQTTGLGNSAMSNAAYAALHPQLPAPTIGMGGSAMSDAAYNALRSTGTLGYGTSGRGISHR